MGNKVSAKVIIVIIIIIIMTVGIFWYGGVGNFWEHWCSRTKSVGKDCQPTEGDKRASTIIPLSAEVHI